MKRGLIWFAAAVPVVFYLVVVIWYAYDFPYMDDYPVVVHFLNSLPDAHTLSQKATLLLEQNNFHRLVLAKLVAWFNVALTGRVDFRVMQWVGLLLLLGTAGLLWLNVRIWAGHGGGYAISPRYGVTPSSPTQPQQATRNTLYFLPILFLLFQFQGWNVAFWPIVAVSNVGAPALALGAFYLAHHAPGRREGWAVAVGLVALFTNGNGILVLPLLVLGWLFQRRWQWAGGTLLLTIPALIFYFHDYHNPSGPSLTQLLSPAKVAHLLALDTAFLGAMVYHPAVAWLPILLGSLTVGWAAYLLWIRYDQTNPTLFWLLIFLHLTGLMLAVNRIQNDTSLVFASRYRNITALHLAATYLSLIDVLIRRVRVGEGRTVRLVNGGVGLVMLVAVGLWAVSNATYWSKIRRFRELKQTDNLLWQRYGQIRACAPEYQPVAELNKLARLGVFRPETSQLTALQSQTVAVPPAPTPGDSLQYALDLWRQDGDFLVVSGWAKVAGRKANFNDTYVGIKTANGWQYYSTLFHQRLDKEDSANDKDTGFTAIIPLTGTVGPTTAPLVIFVRSGRFAARSPALEHLPGPALETVSNFTR